MSVRHKQRFISSTHLLSLTHLCFTAEGLFKCSTLCGRQVMQRRHIESVILLTITHEVSSHTWSNYRAWVRDLKKRKTILIYKEKKCRLYNINNVTLEHQHPSTKTNASLVTCSASHNSPSLRIPARWCKLISVCHYSNISLHRT